MLLVQIPMLSRFTTLDQVYLSASFAVVYVVVMACMGYCAFADPGQVRKTRNMKVGAMDIEEAPDQAPSRIGSKWLQNVIGLLNHREFVVMVGGLVLIAAWHYCGPLRPNKGPQQCQAFVDGVYLAVLIAEKANNTTIGDNIPVEELDDDEYNEIFDRDAFVYDRTRT
eukprot:s528_g13.t1